MRKLLVLVVLVLACGTKGDWKERSGPGFRVVGPYAPKKIDQPITGTTQTMTIYEFGNSITEAMQVQIMDLPPEREPQEAITLARDGMMEGMTLAAENDVSLGEVIGKDLRYTGTFPEAGKLAGRTRILSQRGKLYIVIGLYPVDKSDLAPNADRFVESFKFTTPARAPAAAPAGSGAAQ